MHFIVVNYQPSTDLIFIVQSKLQRNCSPIAQNTCKSMGISEIMTKGFWHWSVNAGVKALIRLHMRKSGLGPYCPHDQNTFPFITLLIVRATELLLTVRLCNNIDFLIAATQQSGRVRQNEALVNAYADDKYSFKPTHPRPLFRAFGFLRWTANSLSRLPGWITRSGPFQLAIALIFTTLRT